MAGNPDNSRLWTGADVYVAPLGTTGPTDLTTAWPAAFKPLGLLGEDAGITEGRSQDSKQFFAYGGVLVRAVQAKFVRTFKFVALEDNPTVFQLTNPGSVVGTPTGGIVRKTIKNPIPNPQAFGFELRDGASVTRRRLIPRAEITDVGDIVFKDEELAAVEFTLTCYPASDGTIYFDLDNEAAFTS